MKSHKKTNTVKIQLNFILLFIIYSLSCYSQPLKYELNSAWKFKQARLSNWYPATVPGVVHTDLVNNKKIADPFFRLNERDVQWIDKEDWIYQIEFKLDEALLLQNNIRLVFDGLDTYADVYLNEKKVLEVDNMFRTWTADVKTLLKPAGNKLMVYFHSPIKKTMKLWEELPFQYRASNDQSENGGLLDRQLSVFTRKAGYHYGWDWGPRLLTSGIWRSVYLEGWNSAKIENIHFSPKEVTKKNAFVVTTVEVLSDTTVEKGIVRIVDQESNKVVATQRCKLNAGLNKIELQFNIENPILWWSNGLGRAHLYKFKTELIGSGVLFDTSERKIGLRSLKVVKSPDKWGKSFYFELNGVPVFAKGANYIPSDNFLPRVTPEKYRETIKSAVDANMNMIRVWGGGIYENDYFYDLCDENGILVWQDFMFACSVYPAEGKLLENIRQEAIENVRRLRNHACLAIWCGNNENLDALFNWGWMNAYNKQNPEYAKIVWTQYENQYRKVLPQVVAEQNPETYYLPTSPFTDYDGRRDKTDGDMHYWQVWQSGLPIRTFEKEKSRFFSEYGFQSFPEFESVKRYAPDSTDWNIYSDVMMWHQRGGVNANKTIEKCTLYEYGKPNSFESGLYLSQLLQADAMKIAIESHRRNMPYCMGSLYWQLNDCWPVASWSSRDYYGRWKAQHYFVRKAFKSVLISPTEDNGNFQVYVVSDKLSPFSAVLTVKTLKLDGTVVSEFSKQIDVPANTSSVQYSEQMTNLLKGAQKQDLLIHVELRTKTETYDNVFFSILQKEMNWLRPHIAAKIKEVDQGYEIELSSDRFVRAVFLSIEDDVENHFSDNFFDILPGQTVKIAVTSKLILEDFKRRLKIVTIFDAL